MTKVTYIYQVHIKLHYIVIFKFLYIFIFLQKMKAINTTAWLLVILISCIELVNDQNTAIPKSPICLNACHTCRSQSSLT